MAAEAIAARRGANLEAGERKGWVCDFAIREFLAERDLMQLDGRGLEGAIAEGRTKGANLVLLREAEARLKEWQTLQDAIAEHNRGVPTWIVVNPDGFVNIRTEPDATSPVMDKVEPGIIIRGFPEGNWIRLYDRSGFMLTVKPDGEKLIDRYEGDSSKQGGKAESLKWVVKLFKFDRLAREGFVFLAPEFHNEDYMTIDAEEMGHHMLGLGSRLYEEGSLPGNPTWEKEESPEIVESVETWRQALEAGGVDAFDTLLRKAAALAEEGYTQMGNLAPRLAALRWTCCLRWLVARSEALSAVSVGASVGTVTPKICDAASRSAKHAIFGWLRSLCKEYPVLTLFDYDLVGNGVWHDARREPLPKMGDVEWYRRGIEFDIVKMCHQANQLPPQDVNASAATFTMVQPYLTPDWILPPPEAPGHIVRKHSWTMEWFQPPIDNLHTKALVQGPVLHIEAPPEFEHDFGDPEVIAKVQRGEDLGKGPQADGLPGAIHESVALLLAATCTVEHVRNLRVYPGLLELGNFFETFLKYGPPLRVLELAGAGRSVTEEILKLVEHAGSSLRILDLSECCLEEEHIQVLVPVLESLPNLQHLDLASNNLDGQAALQLIRSLCESRVDIPSVRLDGNPLGDVEDFKYEVAQCLVARGEQVVAGGELVLHLEDDMIRWCPKTREGEFATRLRDASEKPPELIAIKDMRNMGNARKRELDKYEKENPAAKTAGGRDWLRRQREDNQKFMNSSLIGLYRQEIKHRVAMKEAKEAAEAEEIAGKSAASRPPTAA